MGKTAFASRAALKWLLTDVDELNSSAVFIFELYNKSNGNTYPDGQSTNTLSRSTSGWNWSAGSSDTVTNAFEINFPPRNGSTFTATGIRIYYKATISSSQILFADGDLDSLAIDNGEIPIIDVDSLEIKEEGAKSSKGREAMVRYLWRGEEIFTSTSNTIQLELMQSNGSPYSSGLGSDRVNVPRTTAGFAVDNTLGIVRNNQVIEFLRNDNPNQQVDEVKVYIGQIGGGDFSNQLGTYSIGSTETILSSYIPRLATNTLSWQED